MYQMLNNRSRVIEYECGETYVFGWNTDKTHNGRIISKNGDWYLIEFYGYEYNINIHQFGRVRLHAKTITDESFLRRINDTIFTGTDLQAVDFITKNNGKYILIVNNKTGEIYHKRKSWAKRININQFESKQDRLDRCLNKVKECLGDKYNYDKTICENLTGFAIVTCPKHGDFKININATTMHGCGCRKCAHELAGYGRSQFIKICNKRNVTGKLYLAKCYSEDELFYKIGVTYLNTKKRLRKVNYTIEELLLVGGDADLIFDLEKLLHKKYKEFKYTPMDKFGGYTECFKFEEEEIIKSEILLEYESLLTSATIDNTVNVY